MAEPPTDPRATITATFPDGTTAPVFIADRVSVGRQTIDFPRPIPGIAEYAAVARAEAEAERLRAAVMQGLRYGPDDPIPYQPDAILAMDFRASASTAVSVSVVGLEAFANHHIGRAYDEGGAVVYNGVTYELDGARDLWLNERYSAVLPSILNRPPPKQEQWWQILRRVQALAALTRHSITEAVERNGLSGKRSLAERMYRGEYRGAARMMLAAFEHFSPGWVSAERLSQLPPPPPP